MGCTAKYSTAELHEDPVLNRAVIRSLEIIGEAAKGISTGTREG